MIEHKNTSEVNLKYSFFYSNIEETVPVNCGRMKCLPQHRYGPATRDYYLIHYIFSGKGSLYTDGKEYEVQKDWCFIIHPGEITTYIADDKDPWDYAWLGFKCSPPPDFLADRTMHIPQARSIFERIRKEYIGYGKQWYLLTLIGRLLTELSESKEEWTDRHTNLMLKVKNKIENAYSSPISISRLASECNMERSYFSRTFKHVVGLSPKEYHSKVRIDNAETLLRNRNLSINEVASEVGYPDVMSFSKAFKNKKGMSPSFYRQTQQDSSGNEKNE